MDTDTKVIALSILSGFIILMSYLFYNLNQTISAILMILGLFFSALIILGEIDFEKVRRSGRYSQ